MLQCCVCLLPSLSSPATLCIVAKRYVLEQKLPLTAYIIESRVLSRDKGLVPKEMAYGLSNGHMIGDVTWPRKVKLVIPIGLERNISKTAGDENL